MCDNLVTEWAQNNDWMTNRSEKDTMEENRNFVTFALDNMKLCTFHRKGTGTGKEKEKLSKVPRNLGPADAVVFVRPDCTTLQLCGDSKWVNGDFTVGGKHQKNIGAIQRHLHQWWEQARPIDLNESYEPRLPSTQ